MFEHLYPGKRRSTRRPRQALPTDLIRITKKGRRLLEQHQLRRARR
jgi:hypothetical protein